MSGTESYDVVVVGSGAAGATAALRAAELGFSTIVLEKAHKFGGTSATSGGVLWIPNHRLAHNDDSREQALEYLDGLVKGPVQRDRLEAFVDQGPEMVKFLTSVGVELMPAAWPDYYPTMPGARADRSIIAPTFDGRDLGNRFTLMREQYTRFKLLNRYAMDLAEFFAVSTRGKGWIFVFLNILWRYWTDIGTRRLTKRDRRFTSGAALMGRVYKKSSTAASKCGSRPSWKKSLWRTERLPASRSAISAAVTRSRRTMASSSVPAASSGIRNCATASIPFRASPGTAARPKTPIGARR